MSPGMTTDVEREEARRRWETKRQLERNEFKRMLNDLQAVELVHTDNEDECPPDDLVRGVLGSGSPCGIGGAEKSLKSSLATELAMCIAASEPVKFLNCFNVYENSLRVVYLNYEGTPSEYRDRIRRIERARGVQVNQESLLVLSGFPRLNNDKGLNVLERLLSLREATLVIIDALYLALPGVDFSQLPRMGGHLSDIFDVCRDCDATPVYVHHFGKDSGGRGGLQSFSGTGLAEHIGQWILLHKAGRYDPDTGRHRFRLEIGSRAGFGGRYTLEVTEGRLGDPGGRCWETTVSPITAKPAVEGGDKDTRDELAGAVLAAIKEKPGTTKGGLRKALKRSGRDIGKAVAKLMADGKVEEVEATVRGNATFAYHLAGVGRDEGRTNPGTNPTQRLDVEEDTVVGT